MPIEEAIDIIKKHTIEFVWWHGRIFKSLSSDEVVGINAAASSQLRKRFTIERLQIIIDNEKLPLKIVDRHFHVNRFQVISINI